MPTDDIPAEQQEPSGAKTGLKWGGDTDSDEWWFHLFAIWLFDERDWPRIQDYAAVLPFDEFLRRKREGWYTRNGD